MNWNRFRTCCLVGILVPVLLLGSVGMAKGSTNEPAVMPEVASSEGTLDGPRLEQPVAKPKKEKPGFVHRLLYYIPNRCLDIVDLLRLRVRAGKGWALDVRVTEPMSVFAGNYQAHYFGLPGPRTIRDPWRPWGYEEHAGLSLGVADATDDSGHEAVYAYTEFALGVQLWFVGADIGSDPYEFFDFVAGLITLDPRGDDLPAAPSAFAQGDPVASEETSQIPGPSVGAGETDEKRDERKQQAAGTAKGVVEGVGDAKVGKLRKKLDSVTQARKNAKPATFDNFSQRLDYTHDTLDASYQQYLQVVDRHFAGDHDEEEFLDVPRSNFDLILEVEYDDDRGAEFSFNADISAEVTLPRLEKRMNLFISTENLDSLPGENPGDRENELSVGIGRSLRLGKHQILHNRLGVKWKVPPVAFIQSELRRQWDGEDWFITPSLRGFYETDDGFGSVAWVGFNKWLTDRNLGRYVPALRWTELTDGVEWEQSIHMAHFFEDMVEGERRTDLYRAHRAIGVRASMFGHKTSSSVNDLYRLSFPMRLPLYGRWIYLNLIPELNWRDENDWETDPAVRIQLNFAFWGGGAE